MMRRQVRVLVLENLTMLRGQFVVGIRGAGFDVDGAATLEEAMALVDSKTYHAAIIDLMLHDPEDMTTMEGLLVVDRIRELGEGTRTIVVSGQDDPEAAADAIQEHGAWRYFTKKRIITDGLAPLTDLVVQAANDVRIRHLGSAENILSFLSGANGQGALLWQDRCLQNLSPSGGFQGLKEFFEFWCGELTPLVPLRNSAYRMTLELDPPRVSGLFWSKAIGRSVSLVACRSVDAAKLKGGGDLCMEPCVRQGVSGFVFARPELTRSLFVDKLE